MKIKASVVSIDGISNTVLLEAGSDNSPALVMFALLPETARQLARELELSAAKCGVRAPVVRTCHQFPAGVPRA